MRWESLDWRPVGADNPEGIGALSSLAPLARSAIDEAVSALAMGAVTTVGLSVAAAVGGDLSAEFVPVATFELLGTPRRGVWLALDPGFGTRLGDGDVSASDLGPVIIEALEAVLVEAVGEGLSSESVDALEIDPAAEMVLFRLVMRDPAGSELAIVTAVEAPVPVELATHVVALQALGPATRSAAPETDPAGVPAGAPPATMPAEPAVRTPVPAPNPPAVGVTQPAPSTTIRPFVLEALPPASAAATTQNIELLMGVQLEVTVEIGRTRLAIRDVLALAPGSIVELDKLAGEKVDVLVNGQPIAQGEVVVVDENFGVRITDVVSRQRRILSADGAA
jgi:flagellar motor switch protein FliN/FliY